MNNLKHLTVIAQGLKNTARPVLRNILLDGPWGYTVACDTHRILAVKTNNKRRRVIDLETFELRRADGYPDLKRLVPTSINQEIKIDLVTVKEMLLFIKAHKREILTLKIETDAFSIVASEDEYTAEQANDLESIEIFASGTYLFDALNYIVTTKSGTILKLTDSPVRPFMFTDEDESYIYLVTPVRKQIRG